MEERRHSQRIRAYLPVRMHGVTTPQVVETLTKDISLEGIQCLSTIPCPVTSEVSLELALSTSNEVLELRGRTAWFRMIPHSDQFDVGIAFCDLSSQNKRRLSVYIDHLTGHLAAV